MELLAQCTDRLDGALLWTVRAIRTQHIRQGASVVPGPKTSDLMFWDLVCKHSMATCLWIAAPSSALLRASAGWRLDCVVAQGLLWLSERGKFFVRLSRV